MKISTKGRYGLRAVVYLASCKGTEPASLASIAKSQHLSERYLEQLLAKLKKDDIVTSTRGSSGGYILAKPDTDITVGQVLRALEGDLCVSKCSEKAGECELFDSCVTKYVWERINNSISAVVDHMTIRQVLEGSHQCGNGDEKS